MMDPCAHCEEMMQPYLDHVLTDEEKDQAEAHLCRVRRLPTALQVRGEPADLRAQGGDGRDAGRAAREAGRSQDPAGVGESTSPGGRRSSHGTRRAGSDFAPSSGTPSHSARASRTGWRRTPPYVAATASPPFVASHRRRGRPRAGRGQARRRARRPRPPVLVTASQDHSGARRQARAPSRRTGHSRPAAHERRSRRRSRPRSSPADAASTCGSSSTCFGGSVP